MANPLKYKYFYVSEDFETWQEDNPSEDIIKIEPVTSISMISGDIDTSRDSSNVNLNFTHIEGTIFVVYKRKTIKITKADYTKPSLPKTRVYDDSDVPF